MVKRNNTWAIQIFDEDGILDEEFGYFASKAEAELELLKVEEGGIYKEFGDVECRIQFIQEASL